MKFLNIVAGWKENKTMQWRRNCKPRNGVDLGCRQHSSFHGYIDVDECICDTSLCNKEMGDLPETTTPSTSTLSTTLKISSTTTGKNSIS